MNGDNDDDDDDDWQKIGELAELNNCRKRGKTLSCDFRRI